LVETVEGSAGATEDGLLLQGLSIDPASVEVGNQKVLTFRGFELLPEDRLLLRDGRPVELGGRAFDLLVVLLRSRGKVVSKNEIADHVWPSMIVEESNLRFQMARLRRALGRDGDVIKTVKGRGYLLAADIAGNMREPVRNAAVVRVSNPPSGHATQLRELARREPTGGRPERAIVAVIDDDDATREALDGLLRSIGIRVEAFKSVPAFLDSGRQGHFACLILDVWMPGQSGLDFQDDLVRSGVQLPVIFISGHADIHMSVRAMKAGAVEFLTKPVRHEDLLGAIELALSSPKAA